MILDVQVSGRAVAKLYRELDEYVLKYLPGTASVRTKRLWEILCLRAIHRPQWERTCSRR